ncbi:hypothetical protein TCAL_03752 [Tigriopus californicus]|uniref:Uncharacterized protein n=2 Tax=Tigriopus californicus TaxID=6832 RepID=A0A553NPZ0_TIGCA|nr:hypothetical protein TCAL_03752 [Tigriopus californicus]|eukprot:TCALIF_03752-PA protein Name:"Protein of unknown function" AED:0.00 eAED:0.00 QI:27/1/1/1/0.33/0.25/4/100/188
MIEVGGNGYALMESDKVIDNAFEQTITLQFINLRENEFKMLITWDCCVSDMDTVAYIYGDTDCSLSIHGSCSRGEDGLLQQTNDITSHSTGKPEYLDWTGFFPNNDIHLMGLNGRGQTMGPNWFWNTGLNMTLIGASHSVEIIPKVQSSTTQRFWIAGCFKPSEGLLSFREINQYVDSVTRELCPIVG